eukprot:Lankesteria_metandrocarpae@DN10341_c0_g1_i1.p1
MSLSGEHSAAAYGTTTAPRIVNQPSLQLHSDCDTHHLPPLAIDYTPQHSRAAHNSTVCAAANHTALSHQQIVVPLKVVDWSSDPRHYLIPQNADGRNPTAHSTGTPQVLVNGTHLTDLTRQRTMGMSGLLVPTAREPMPYRHGHSKWSSNNPTLFQNSIKDVNGYAAYSDSDDDGTIDNQLQSHFGYSDTTGTRTTKIQRCPNTGTRGLFADDPPCGAFGGAARRFGIKAQEGYHSDSGLTKPRRGDFKSLSQMAAAYSNLNGTDQDDVVDLLMACRKLEIDIQSQQTLIDLLESDLVQARETLQTPPEAKKNYYRTGTSTAARRVFDTGDTCTTGKSLGRTLLEGELSGRGMPVYVRGRVVLEQESGVDSIGQPTIGGATATTTATTTAAHATTTAAHATTTAAKTVDATPATSGMGAPPAAKGSKTGGLTVTPPPPMLGPKKKMGSSWRRLRRRYK